MAIDRGTVPELKSDEFLDLRILVLEIWSIVSVKPPKKVLHILGAPPPDTATAGRNSAVGFDRVDSGIRQREP